MRPRISGGRKAFSRASPDDPLYFLDNPDRIRKAWAGRPQLKRLVPVANVAYVVGEVAISCWVRVGEPEPAAKQFNVGRISRKKGPPLSHMMHFHIVGECSGRVFLWLKTEGIHEDLAPNFATQDFLHFDQVRSSARAELVAVGEHEIQGHDAILHQVVVKSDLPAVVGGEGDVREVALVDDFP